MRISEITIDDSQTGDYWVQIKVGNKRQAYDLKEQILREQAIKERLEKEIQSCKNIVEESTKEIEVMIHNFFLEKLLAIKDDNSS